MTDAVIRTRSTVAVPTTVSMVRRILATFRQATPDQVDQGARWYREAGQTVADVAERGGISVERAAIVVAHLSPRTRWARNIAGAYQVVMGEPVDGCMGANVARARLALAAVDPWSTFGERAHKIRRFAANLTGNTDQVTVDVWAMRVAMVGTDDDMVRVLRRPGGYEAVESAYQRAAQRAGVVPSTAQAVTWIIARNGRTD